MAKHLSPLDARLRSEEEERRINVLVAGVLGTQAGKELMDYLRSITTNVAAGPEISDRALMHLEGQRYLVGLLSQRIQNGHRENHNVTRESSQGGTRRRRKPAAG